MDIQEKKQVLKSIDVLSFFHEATLERLAEESREVALNAGDLLFREGEKGGTMYIVLRGEIRIFRQDVDITIMGRGSFFGEMALIENQPRSASAQALCPTVLMEINENQFQGFFAGQPQVLMAIMKTMSARFRKVSGHAHPFRDLVAPESKPLHDPIRDLENNLGPLVLFDADTLHIVRASDMVCTQTGYSQDDLRGRDFLDLLPQVPPEEFAELISSLVNKTRPLVVREDHIQRKDKSVFTGEMRLQVIDGAQARPQIIACLEDITERKEMEDAIRQMAYYDSLTGLPNRNLLNDRLAVALARANRNQERVCILFLDLDNFKTVNDTLGHGAGDLLLKDVAHRLQGAMRKEDTIARMGGDEFIVVAPEVRESKDASILAEKILNQFKAPVLIENNELFVGCSIGVAMYPEDGENGSTLLKNADMALYRAKDLGRNNFQLYTPALNRKALERMAIEKNLRKALDRDEFNLVYQPRVDLKTGHIVAVEALVRWESPELGPMMPADFIPVAEDTRFIVQLGIWTLQQACQALKTWQDAGLDLSIAVNLSTVQFTHPRLLKEIRSTLESYGIPPEKLELEITESILMRDTELAVEVLNQICDLGLKVAIDDFGTGYSSLNYLKNLPIHYLKIDQTFVQDFDQPTNLAIIKAIVALGQSLGLRTIAEGVETSKQCEFLKSIQCDEAQGYLFSHPETEDTLRPLLLSGKIFA